MDSITLHIAGDDRHIAPEVFFLHVARTLRNMSLQAGRHEIEIGRDGSVFLNGLKVHDAARPAACARPNNPTRKSGAASAAALSGQLRLAI